MWNIMLFSDSSVALNSLPERSLTAKRFGIAAEESPSFYTSIRKIKDTENTNRTNTLIPSQETSKREKKSNEQGGFQQFKQQLGRMWKRWKKPLLLVGGVLTVGTLGTVTFFAGKHFIYENVKTSLIPEREELGFLWERFQNFQDLVNQQKQSQVKSNGMAIKVKGGYDLVALFQDALDIEKFIYNEISDADRKSKANTIIKTVLDYALDYEQDVLPTLIRRLHKSQRLTSILDETKLPPIETPFRKYIQQHKSLFDSDPILKAPFARYENDRRAVEAFKAFHVSKDAQYAVQEARLFQQKRKANQAESNLEIACMLDLYSTYLKDYHPSAFQALTTLAKKLEKQNPAEASTLIPEDLKALTQATHLNIALYPWEVKEDPIYFSQCLRDLMDKIISKQDISPQNHGYHKKMYG
jgi:hypothetical protein